VRQAQAFLAAERLDDSETVFLEETPDELTGLGVIIND